MNGAQRTDADLKELISNGMDAIELAHSKKELRESYIELSKCPGEYPEFLRHLINDNPPLTAEYIFDNIPSDMRNGVSQMDLEVAFLLYEEMAKRRGAKARAVDALDTFISVRVLAGRPDSAKPLFHFLDNSDVGTVDGQFPEPVLDLESGKASLREALHPRDTWEYQLAQLDSRVLLGVERYSEISDWVRWNYSPSRKENGDSPPAPTTPEERIIARLMMLEYWARLQVKSSIPRRRGGNRQIFSEKETQDPELKKLLIQEMSGIYSAIEKGEIDGHKHGTYDARLELLIKIMADSSLPAAPKFQQFRKKRQTLQTFKKYFPYMKKGEFEKLSDLPFS